MKKYLARTLGLIALMAACVFSTSLAGAKSLTPLTTQLVIINADSKGTTITVSAAVAEDAKLPAEVELLAPNFCKLKSLKAFDSKTGVEGDTIKFTKVTEKNTKAKTVQFGYTTTLSKQRGIKAVFTAPAMMNDAMGAHQILGIGWTTKTDADTLTIGIIAPKGKVGIGAGINLLGGDTAGNRIYGKTFKTLKANTEYILQVGLEDAPKAAETTSVEPTKTSFFQTQNALLIIILGSVLLIAIVALMIVLIKGRSNSATLYDENDEDEYDEDEVEEIDDADK